MRLDGRLGILARKRTRHGDGARRDRVCHDGHVETDFDDVTKDPFVVDREVRAGRHTGQCLTIQLDRRALARPFGNAELERHFAAALSVAHDAREVATRIKRVHVERDLLAIRELALHERGGIEVEHGLIALRAEEFLEEAEEAARTVRRAAVRVHEAVMLPVVAVARERRVARELAAVRLHRAQVGVVEGAFELVGPLRLARDVEQLFAEAHPRGRHAGLLQTHIGEMLLLRTVEPGLGAGAAAGEVDLIRDDLVARRNRSVEELLTSRHLVVFDEPLVAAHHLIGLPAVVLHHVAAVRLGLVAVAIAVRHGDTLEGEVEKARPRLGLGHALHEECREIEVFLVVRAIVEPHHGLKDGRTREAAPVASLPELAPALTARADLVDHVVAHAAAGVQHLLVLCVVVVVQKSHHRVLHAPHIPTLAAAKLVRIVADVAIRLLRGEHALDAAVDGRLELRRPRVLEVRHRGVHVLTPKLRLPPAVAFRLLLERRGDVVDIRANHVLSDHHVELIAHPPLQRHIADAVEGTPRREHGSRAQGRQRGHQVLRHHQTPC